MGSVIIKNMDKFNEAMELLKEVYLEKQSGEIVNLKYINIELLSDKQAKKRKIKDKELSLETVTKYKKDLSTLNVKIINESTIIKEIK